MTRAAIYARYSSAQQRDASLADQVEVCRRYVEQQGWTLAKTYTDAALSGASRHRPGFLALAEDATKRKFEVVVCEAVDRLGRRLADTANLHDTLAFHGIRLFTPQLGEITAMHIGIMGMMAQLALKDLGEKTRRGQLGRVLKGKIAGGLAYGYRIVAASDGRGGRAIDVVEAAVVERIFRAYAAGKSPEAIAHRLNREGVPGPGGRLWSNTTIRGQADRGTGLLNNPIYHGVLEWNRCSYVKDPRTGRRVARVNAVEKRESVTVPELRIVEDELWSAVKARQQAVRHAASARPRHVRSNRPGTALDLNAAHRQRFLLSGLLRCGRCGGGYTVTGKDRYGCATRRHKGTCDNASTITRQQIEARVLAGLKDRLLAPELVAEFVAEYRQETERRAQLARAGAAAIEQKLAAVERRIAGIVKAVEDGMYNPSMKARMTALEAERAALVAEQEASVAPPSITLHPNLPELYRRKVAELERLLGDPALGDEAMTLIRSMIEKVVLIPCADAKGIDAVLHGDLAAIIAACEDAKRPGLAGAGRVSFVGQLSVVAGAGFEPATFRL
jgi:site-specific DNA recombinase